MGSRGPRRDGAAPRHAPLLRRRVVHHRGHRALRVHARRRGRRLRPRAVPRDPRLVEARRGAAAAPRDHRLGRTATLLSGLAALIRPPKLSKAREIAARVILRAAGTYVATPAGDAWLRRADRVGAGGALRELRR